ncbi:hypothetical protein [Streptomyces fragilis]|uniref:Thioredoxin domain-containing protein n=1 Tax=Streptomyces fragilis TaxID=67301 RepID=A0ABV2YDB6_9ACTN|nr:hypothetical protein [Streptomyces fragilis]
MIALTSVLALLVGSLSLALSLAVALRVKKLLDPLTEEGVLSRGRRDSGPEPGEAVPAMPAVADFRGEEVELPVGGHAPWILTFQAVDCNGCKQQLPAYKKFLRNAGVERDRVFSVVMGAPEGVAFYAEELGDLSRVIPQSGITSELVETLGVSVFPTYAVVEGDRVVHAVQSSARLATTAPRFLSRTMAIG